MTSPRNYFYNDNINELQRAIDGSQAYREVLDKWRASQTCSRLIDAMTDMQLPKITKIICFGLDTLHRNGDQGLERSRTQHAAVEIMRAHLEKTQINTDVKVFCQSPTYDTIDEKILHSMRMKIIGDPTGFLEIDYETLVYCVSPKTCVRQIVADMDRPAAMLWTTINPTLEVEIVRETEPYRRGSTGIPQPPPGSPL